MLFIGAYILLYFQKIHVMWNVEQHSNKTPECSLYWRLLFRITLVSYEDLILSMIFKHLPLCRDHNIKSLQWNVYSTCRTTSISDMTVIYIYVFRCHPDVLIITKIMLRDKGGHKSDLCRFLQLVSIDWIFYSVLCLSTTRQTIKHTSMQCKVCEAVRFNRNVLVNGRQAIVGLVCLATSHRVTSQRQPFHQLHLLNLIEKSTIVVSLCVNI